MANAHNALRLHKGGSYTSTSSLIFFSHFGDGVAVPHLEWDSFGKPLRTLTVINMPPHGHTCLGPREAPLSKPSSPPARVFRFNQTLDTDIWKENPKVLPIKPFSFFFSFSSELWVASPTYFLKLLHSFLITILEIQHVHWNSCLFGSFYKPLLSN